MCARERVPTFACMAKVGKLGRVGGWVSIACAVHCMLSPILLGLIPIFRAQSPLAETIEKALIGLSVLIGVSAIAAGYREHHRKSVIVMLLFSLAFLGAGLRVDALIVAGALLMAIAQFLNIRYQRNCCHHDGKASRSELSSIANRV